jgi:hypothetical protein
MKHHATFLLHCIQSGHNINCYPSDGAIVIMATILVCVVVTYIVTLAKR